MSLAAYQESFAEIPAGNTSIRLFPLSLDDLGVLQRRHQDQLMDVLLQFKEHFAAGQLIAVEFAILGVVCTMSDLVADAIALSAREADQSSAAKRLPVDVQVAAIGHIVRLSYETALHAGAKNEVDKLLENVLQPFGVRMH